MSTESVIESWNDEKADIVSFLSLPPPFFPFFLLPPTLVDFLFLFSWSDNAAEKGGGLVCHLDGNDWSNTLSPLTQGGEVGVTQTLDPKRIRAKLINRSGLITLFDELDHLAVKQGMNKNGGIIFLLLPWSSSNQMNFEGQFGGNRHFLGGGFQPHLSSAPSL